jgi:hemerythrin-like domain-containing protein
MVQARGPLMVEHRLIERVIALISRSLPAMRATGGSVDPLWVDAVVDFVRLYADRTHHGKEEDIMFRELKARPLSATDRQVMDALVEDHQSARRITRAVVDANARYRAGEPAALGEMVTGLEALVALYPGHIAREDKVFFPAARKYLTDEEDKRMLEEFWEFDRKMIHEKYRQVVETLEREHGL